MNRALKTTLAFALVSMLATSALAGSLAAQIDVLQQHLEKDFEGAGSIIQLVYESPTSDKVVNLDEMEDSAIWTGVYLASQCFRFASSQNESDKAAARAQISWALDSIDRLYEVTGTPGLPARFAFDPKSPNFRNLKIGQIASTKNGWKVSTTLPGWLFRGDTSRDQYTGIFFGLAVCHRLVSDDEVRTRAAEKIAQSVQALYNNDWRIPVPHQSGQTSDAIPIFAQVTWLQLAQLVDPSWKELAEKRMERLKFDLGNRLEPSGYNNLMEYYGWNLGYLRYYTLLAFDDNSEDHKFFHRLFESKVWEETSSHENTMFTFMKLGTIGRESPADDVALRQAKESLTTLAFRNRRDFAIRNSTDMSIPRDEAIKGLGWFFKTVGLDNIHFFTKLEVDQAQDPLPMAIRPPSDFMWQRSPFQLDGGSGGTIESPSVDTIFAYWLGRYHGLLTEKE